MDETKKRGFPIVKCAVDLFLRESFDSAKAPWLLFLSKAESLFAKAEAWAKEDPSDFRWKYVLTPEEVKGLTDESVERQMRENMLRKTTTPPVNEADPSELIGDVKPTVTSNDTAFQRLNSAKAGK